MQDIFIGKENQEHNKMAELMKYQNNGTTDPGEISPEEVGIENEEPT